MSDDERREVGHQRRLDVSRCSSSWRAVVVKECRAWHVFVIPSSDRRYEPTAGCTRKAATLGNGGTTDDDDAGGVVLEPMRKASR